MEDEEFITTLAGHLSGDHANRVRLLTDPVRMDNVAADLAFDDPALRNALRSLADLRVERTFLGLHRPTREVLDELAQRLSHQQGIRDDTARRCVWLIDSAYFGARVAGPPVPGGAPLPPVPQQVPQQLLHPGPQQVPHPGPQPGVPAPAHPNVVPPTPLVPVPGGGQIPAPRHTPAQPPAMPPPAPYRPGPPAPAPGQIPLPSARPGVPLWRRPAVLVSAAVVVVAALGLLSVLLSRGPGLEQVGGLTADTASAPGSIVLSWRAVEGAGEYEVCRDGGRCEQVSVTKFTDTPGDESTHTYTVQARAGQSRSAVATVAAAAAGSTGLSTAEQELVATLSDDLVNKRTCKRVNTQASAGVTCEAASGAGVLSPKTFWVLQYDTRDEMEKVFAADTPGITTPSCPNSNSTTWSSAANAGVDVGNIACYRTTSDNKAVVAWTYWNRKVIIYGVSKANDIDSVYQWWKSAPIPSA